MPARLGRYAVRRRIGSGGFATVWLAYDEQLDSPVAIKVLAENWTEDCHVRQRFLEEGRYLRKVESPHVVTRLRRRLARGRPALPGDVVRRPGHARRPARGRRADRRRRPARWSARSGDGLHGAPPARRPPSRRQARQRAVPHRRPRARRAPLVRAMVGDLGLGKALDVSSRLTMIAGTPSFVAPEQAQGEHLDARADQYSLAALAYLLLSGRPPYSHSSLSAAAAPPPPPPLSTPERPFPPAVEDVVRRGLAADRDDRFPDVPVVRRRAARGPRRGRDGRRSPRAGCRSTPSSPSPATGRRSCPSDDDLPAPVPPKRRPLVAGRRRSRWCCSWPAAWAGTPRGSTPTRPGRSPTTTARLSVTVPVVVGPRRVARRAGCRPAARSASPALSVGNRPDWRGIGRGRVRRVCCPRPSSRPRCPSTRRARSPARPERGTSGDPSVTAVSTGCPGVVIIERADAGEPHQAALGTGAQRRPGDRRARCSTRCGPTAPWASRRC